MRNIILILSFLLAFSCNENNMIQGQNSNEEIKSIQLDEELTVSSINSSLECHMCPGYILVQRGERIDTIESGVWGKPGKYVHFQKENEHYIAFPGGYYSGGTSETSIRIISLNHGNYLEKVFDTLVSDSFQSEMEVRRISFDFLPPDTLSFLSYTELYNAKDESSKYIDSSYVVNLINYR